jgi:sugar/nucleoside kinase (ribokinase family)
MSPRSNLGLTSRGTLSYPPRVKTSSILTVGSLAFDSIETPAGKADRVLGGSGNYFSVAASFYAPVQVVGVVGRDFPKSHIDWLAQRRIDTTGIEVVDGETFHWVGSYNQNLNEAKTLSTRLNVFEHFDPKLSSAHRDADYVFLANIDPVLQQSVLDQVRSPKLVACDSMNFWITGKPDALRETLKRVDILSVNEGEAYLLSGEKNLVKAATIIRTMGPSVVIIKRGEYGAMLFTPAGTFIAPAFPVERVVDPTGAGDSFAGAFMGFLAEAGAHRDLARENTAEWDRILRRAVLAGCVMASFTVEDFSLHRLMRLENKELVERQHGLMKMLSV